MSNDSADEGGLPLGAVIVINPGSWRTQVNVLGQLLAAYEGMPAAMRVIPDASGRSAETTLTIACPRYWSQHLQELGDALRSPEAGGTRPTPRVPAGVGAMSEAPTRLTWTVEEAAVALGISRAFAYDAVRRGDIPAIKIGRRILVPRSALDRLLERSQRRSTEFDGDESARPPREPSSVPTHGAVRGTLDPVTGGHQDITSPCLPEP
jgi:excisionase family DNA binding protein